MENYRGQLFQALLAMVRHCCRAIRQREDVRVVYVYCHQRRPRQRRRPLQLLLGRDSDWCC